MEAKTIEQPVDPALQAEQQQAKQDQVAAFQTQAQSDTASLMARYGTKLALSGVTSQAAKPAAAGGV